MSHYLGYVFIREKDKECLYEVLEKYNENTEVEPYIKYTKQEAEAIATNWCKTQYNKILEIKNSSEYEENKEVIDTALEILFEDLNGSPYEEYFNGELKDEVNGNILTTCNPNGKWDWWEFGGRFSDSLIHCNGEEIEDGYIDEIDWEKTHVPICYVDINGEWHSRGDVGWFGSISNEKEEVDWDAEFNAYVKYLLSLEESILVFQIDFHI